MTGELDAGYLDAAVGGSGHVPHLAPRLHQPQWPDPAGLKGKCHDIFDLSRKNSAWVPYEQIKTVSWHFRFREDIREKRVLAWSLTRTTCQRGRWLCRHDNGYLDIFEGLSLTIKEQSAKKGLGCVTYPKAIFLKVEHWGISKATIACPHSRRIHGHVILKLCNRESSRKRIRLWNRFSMIIDHVGPGRVLWAKICWSKISWHRPFKGTVRQPNEI